MRSINVLIATFLVAAPAASQKQTTPFKPPVKFRRRK